MSIWVKLGPQATVFVDPATKLEVTSQTEPVEVPRTTKRIQEAIRGGHLVKIEETSIPEDYKAQARSLKEKNDAETNKILGITEGKASTETKEKSGKGKGRGGNKNKPAEQPETDEQKFKAMTPDQRAAYYKENYQDITDEDIKEFKAMNDDDQVQFLLED